MAQSRETLRSGEIKTYHIEMKSLQKLLLNSFVISTMLSCCSKQLDKNEVFLQNGIVKTSLPKMQKVDIIHKKKYAICLNDPYTKNLKNTYILIYALQGGDKYLVSFNKFTKDFEVFIPENLNDQLVHFMMYIIVDNKNGSYTYFNFQDESVVKWKNNYNYIYIGFFSNDEQKIRFIPHEDLVLQ